MDGYLQVVLDRCTDWLGASGASIFLQTGKPTEYVLAAKAGHESSAPEDATIVSGEGIAGASIESKKPILIDDPRNHPALKNTALKRNGKWGSSLVVPLLTPDQECIGVLNLSRTKDEPRFSEDDLRSARSLAGHIALAVANGRLLSRLRVAVAEATDTHEKLDNILSSIAIGIIVIDSDGIVTHLNPEAVLLVGSHAVPDQHFDDFVESAMPEMRPALRRIAGTGSAGKRSSAVIQVRATGQAFTVTSSPLNGGGSTLAIQETTEHENVMREMSRVRRLAEIGQMTAAIAHEIRNPLWAMRAAAQVLQTDASVAAEFGKIIEAEVDKLTELCNDFLDFARPLELNLQDVALGEVVRSIVEQHVPLFEEKGVVLLADCDSLERVQADPLRLEQILRNLLLNALDASPPGGSVSIGCRDGEIVVQDAGKGMEQDSMERLFTPFFTTKANGTGLGLSTVRKIIDAHGGAIDVQSAPGKGTKFSVRLKEDAA